MPIHIEGNSKLVVLLSDLHAHVAFGVVNNFVLQILLGTSYIDRFINGMFPLEQRITPAGTRPVDILASYSCIKATNVGVTDYAEKDYHDVQLSNRRKLEQRDSILILVRKSWRYVISPFRESPALAVACAVGLLILDPHQNKAKNRTVLNPKAFMEAVLSKPVFVLIGNITPLSIHIQRRGYVAFVSPL